MDLPTSGYGGRVDWRAALPRAEPFAAPAGGMGRLVERLGVMGRRWVEGRDGGEFASRLNAVVDADAFARMTARPDFVGMVETIRWGEL